MKPILPYHHPRRLCACGCGRRFRPTDTLGPVSTEYYIDGSHALTGMARRQRGILPVVQFELVDQRTIVRPKRKARTARPSRKETQWRLID